MRISDWSSDVFSSDLVVNLALPYQDLSIMEACLKTGVHYMDTANYEPRDEAKFEYHWQWAYHDRFKDAGLMALLGSGFDPGVTSVFATYLKKHYLDRIDTLDILDCNGGRSEEHTSELQSLMRISYAVFCLKKKIKQQKDIPVINEYQ